MSTTQSNVFYRRFDREPLNAIKTLGNYIYLSDGKKLLDGGVSAAVASIGYGDTRVITGLNSQLQTISFAHSGTFTTEVTEELAEVLTKDSGMKKALFVSGGSEAIETAIKLVRQYHLEKKQPERVNFIARRQSYHGNSLGALSLGNHRSRRTPFSSLLSDCFHHISPCFAYRYKFSNESDEEYVQRLGNELEAKFQELGPNTVAAFFAETIVGATSGCTPAVSNYFKTMREICDRHGALFVLDEIMCGMGRTGKLHAWQWEGLSSPPDIQLNGKGLTSGYAPLSAVLISEKVVDAFVTGSGSFLNGFTYQFHAIGCRAALEVLKVMKEDKLIEQCYQRGLFLEQTLQLQLENHPHVGDIRGRGLFWSVEFVKNKQTKEMYPANIKFVDNIAKECINRGVALYPGIKGTYDGILGDHIIIAPPFTITEQEILNLVDILKTSINIVLSSSLDDKSNI